jgi:hypothetical protein
MVGVLGALWNTFAVESETSPSARPRMPAPTAGHAHIEYERAKL